MRIPLAERMRPRHLEQMVGHERWLGQDAPLRKALLEGQARSMIFWGPPGCGKTTLARALAEHAKLPFFALSATLDGIKELRAVLERAEVERRLNGRGAVVFIDEIHRWNKAQQDALLPHIETGLIVLIGATTENPSFELNAALRSRLQIIRFDPLDTASIVALLKRAVVAPEGLAERFHVDTEVLEVLASTAAGDARRALEDLERCTDTLSMGQSLDLAHAQRSLQRSDIRHDRHGDHHFDVVSALIKSLRGSDPDAAIYWLARMIAGGEDPKFIARRLIIFASEDVGNADPRALQVAIAAAQAVDWVGMPEGRIPLAQAVTWLATCPKSNASYIAINQALEEVKRSGALPVPFHLRNAPTPEMKAEGFGVEYRYPHDFPGHVVAQDYLPSPLIGRHWYQPSGMGEEKRVLERLEWFQKKKGER